MYFKKREARVRKDSGKVYNEWEKDKAEEYNGSVKYDYLAASQRILSSMGKEKK